MVRRTLPQHRSLGALCANLGVHSGLGPCAQFPHVQHTEGDQIEMSGLIWDLWRGAFGWCRQFWVSLRFDGRRAHLTFIIGHCHPGVVRGCSHVSDQHPVTISECNGVACFSELFAKLLWALFV